MGTIHIRRISIEDVSACHRIERICFEPDEAASLHKIQARQRIFADGFLVALEEDSVVGFINSAATNQPDLSDEAIKDLIGHEADGSTMVILSLAVDPPHQGKGISSRLMRSFIEQWRSSRKTSICLLCKEHLIGFYAKFGFVDRGRSDSEHGGSRWHEMALRI